MSRRTCCSPRTRARHAQAALEIDLRDIDEPRRDAVLGQILEAAADIAARRRVRLQTEVVNRDAPATCAPEARPAKGHHGDLG